MTLFIMMFKVLNLDKLDKKLGIANHMDYEEVEKSIIVIPNQTGVLIINFPF